MRPADGRAGLADVREATIDVVVLDAFEDGRVPADLLTTDWFAAVARVLTPGGVLAANLSDQAPFRLVRDAVAGLGRCLPDLVVSAEPATLRGRRAGNVLVVAGVSGVPHRELAARATSSVAPYRVLVAGQVGDFFGGGTPRGLGR